MPENTMKKPHILTLDNRKLLTLSGVEDVSGFDEQTINVKLSDATLVVKGTGLHISKLSLESGDVVIDGLITSLQYLGASNGSLRSRLFR
ncbi:MULTISPECIES: YabP/YqfC family sporulation protein [Ruminococcus]|uniref:Sporulation protein YabP n=1 Tax=Ruminococcus difficilis TaxID=2763069 RepID=A0A935C3S8_9FIRM|nr:YabP/YqfC family sporulation protein [Ruminococcus difficilis]MBK6089177.1 sporulation protein YabP [Ruminococcus difficilis]